jgi:enterochelin esterase-like enzyme
VLFGKGQQLCAVGRDHLLVGGADAAPALEAPAHIRVGKFCAANGLDDDLDFGVIQDRVDGFRKKRGIRRTGKVPHIQDIFDLDGLTGAAGDGGRIAAADLQHTVAQWRKQAANGTIRNIPANGTVNKIDIPATKSQFEARKALVYLPPAALADSKRKPALPVVLMLSGQPGSPGRVFQAGGIQTMMDGYAKTHDGLAPIVIAADQLGADSHNTLCVDSKVYGNALTYLTQDVVDWVKTNLPAAQNAKDWAIAGFSQGATCSLQIGVNHPDLFGTMIPTDSEIKPTNGSRQEMIDRFFDGDTTAYENQVPVNAIRNHAPTHQMLIIGAGEKDTASIRNVKTIAPVAAKAGMRVAAVESSGNAHDWHAVQDVLRYGLAVFGHDTGLDGANPNLSDYPNLKRITI